MKVSYRGVLVGELEREIDRRWRVFRFAARPSMTIATVAPIDGLRVVDVKTYELRIAGGELWADDESVRQLGNLPDFAPEDWWLRFMRKIP